jgi:hypothetical protein
VPSIESEYWLPPRHTVIVFLRSNIILAGVGSRVEQYCDQSTGSL